MMELNLPPLLGDIGEEGRGATLEKGIPHCIHLKGIPHCTEEGTDESPVCKERTRAYFGGDKARKSLTAVQIKREEGFGVCCEEQ